MELWNKSISDKDRPCLIFIDVEPSSTFIDKYLHTPVATNPSCVIIIFSNDEALDRTREQYKNKSYYKNHQLKIWGKGESLVQLETELENLRTPIPFCKNIISEEDDPLKEQISDHLKSHRRAQRIAAEEVKSSIQEYYKSNVFLSRLHSVFREHPPRVYVDRACNSNAVKRFSDAIAMALEELGCIVYIHPKCEGPLNDYTFATNIEIAHFKPDLIIRSPNSIDDTPAFCINPGPPTIYPLQDFLPHMHFLRHIKQHPLGIYDTCFCILPGFRPQYINAGLNEDQIMCDFIPSPSSKVEAITPIYDVGFAKTMSHAQHFSETVEIKTAEESQQAEMLDRQMQEIIQKKLYRQMSFLDFAGFFPIKWMEQGQSYLHHLFCKHTIHQLADKEFSLSLVGSHWNNYPNLKQYSRGHMESREEYARTFLECRINISLHPWVSYHPRIFEGGNLGAFFLVYRVPDEVQWHALPEDLKPGVHYDDFSTEEELVTKCRYYLENPEERHKIGQNLKKLLCEKYSYRHFGERVLKKFEHLIEKNRYRSHGEASEISKTK